MGHVPFFSYNESYLSIPKDIKVAGRVAFLKQGSAFLI
jgi:hypothetical protein